MVQPVLRNSCLRIYSFNMARSMSSSWRWVFTWMLSLTSIRRFSAFSNFYIRVLKRNVNAWEGILVWWDQWVRRRSSDDLKEYFRLAGLLENCRIVENVDLLMSAMCQYFDWYAEKHNQKRSEFLGFSGKMDHSQKWSTSDDQYIHNIIPSTPETMV